MEPPPGAASVVFAMGMASSGMVRAVMTATAALMMAAAAMTSGIGRIA